MTTLPPEPTRFSDRDPRYVRQVAESFGSEAERYDRTRPRYPQPMVDAIIAATPGREFLDVGVGTGVSARPFLEAGCLVLGVDADARMADFARECGIEVEIARFEEWDPAGRTFDGVIAGQTWHWVDPVAGAAKAADVLRPGGRLAVFWNVMQPPSDLWKAFGEVYRRVMPDWPFFGGMSGGLAAYSGQLDKAAEGMREVATFSHPEQWQFDWQRTYTRDDWLDQVPTFGGHIQLPPSQLDELLAGLGTAVDAVGGTFVMGYAAVVVTAAKAAA